MGGKDFIFSSYELFQHIESHNSSAFAANAYSLNDMERRLA